MRRILCLFGFHRWVEHKRRLSHIDPQREVYRVFEYCFDCRRERQWYDTGE